MQSRVYSFSKEEYMKEVTILKNNKANSSIQRKTAHYVELFRTSCQVDGEYRIMVQKHTACTRLDCCVHLHTLCLYNPAPRIRGPIPSLLATWMALLPTKAGDVEINPGPTTHTSTHSSNLDM